MKTTKILAATMAALLLISCNTVNDSQKPNEESVELTRQALETWKNDHFGMFIHFGVYSKLGGIWKNEKVPFYGEQIMNHARITVPEYEEVARTFNPVNFNADEIVTLAKDAGMKYIVITTKHHDGFCMFHTSTTDYNIVDFTPYGKDIVKELSTACQRHGMKLGFYYSLPDWHYPYGIPRLEPDNDTKCWEYVNQVYSPLEIVTPELEEYIVKQITELLTNYGEITTIWFDMGLISPEQSARFRETVKSIQPQCLINGRIMNNMGDYMTLPDNGDVASYGDIYWDNPASLYGTWGYKSWINRPELSKQINTQIGRLTSTVSHGGVFLLNIGPDGSGKVIDYEKDVLLGIGDFLKENPDTLDILAKTKNENIKTVKSGKDEDITLTVNNGLFHAALDGTGYMSVETESWLSWNVVTEETSDYDVFIIYNPENNDKKYSIKCNVQELILSLPGVDRMVQTAYFGTLKLEKGLNEIILDQTDRCYPLENIGLKLEKILLKKK
ncbi:MAG: alpha-L-fucosidase [Candidatus Limimorpha sp.]